MGGRLTMSLTFLVRPLLASDISVVTHSTHKFLGLTFDLDTLWCTAIAMAVVIVLGVMLRRQVTSGVPGKLQLAWETGVNAVARQIEGSIGPRGLAIVPLALTLFFFILVVNLLEVFEVGSKVELIAPPTDNVNLPAAMAIFVIVLVHIASVRSRGIRGYLRHYFTHPISAQSRVGRIGLAVPNLVLTMIEEIAKPVTLALRLFGNLFSGALMISLIAALGVWKFGSVPIGDLATFLLSIIWKLFDVFFIGPIQAFIFALLTILYFDAAMAVDH